MLSFPEAVAQTCSVKKVFLKISLNSHTGKHLCQSLFFNEDAEHLFLQNTYGGCFCFSSLSRSLSLSLSLCLPPSLPPFSLSLCLCLCLSLALPLSLCLSLSLCLLSRAKPYAVLPKNKPVPHLEFPRLLILQNGITLRQKISQHLKPYDVQRI